MQRRVSVFLFLGILVPLYSQVLNGWVQDLTPDVMLSFTEKSIVFKELGTQINKHEIVYLKEEKNNLCFISFTQDFKFGSTVNYLNDYFHEGFKRWLILFMPGYMYAYERGKELPVFSGFL